jgi:hypothetical protein
VPLVSDQIAPDLIETHETFDFDDLVREILPLEEKDLVALAIAGPSRSMAEVQHIRAYHHVAALKLASGIRASAVAFSMGLSPQTITRLLQSPHFAELVLAYRERMVDKAVDHFSLMEMVAGESLTAIHERLTDVTQRSEMGIGTLIKLSETFVDRIGHSPVRRSESSSVHRVSLDDETIHRIKALHPQARRWNDPTGSIESTADAHEALSLRSGAASGAAAVFFPPPGEDRDRNEGEGESL